MHRGRRRAAARRSRPSRVADAELGQPSATTSACGSTVWPSRACAGQHPADQRPGRGAGRRARTPGMPRRATRSASAGVTPGTAEQPPRVVAQQPRRRRPEQVDGAPGDPGVQAGRHQQLGHLVGRAGGDERRQQPPGPLRTDLGQPVQRSTVTSAGAVDPGLGQLAGQRRPSPGHRPAAQNAANTGSRRVAVSWHVLGVAERRGGHVVERGADLARQLERLAGERGRSAGRGCGRPGSARPRPGRSRSQASATATGEVASPSAAVATASTMPAAPGWSMRHEVGPVPDGRARVRRHARRGTCRSARRRRAATRGRCPTPSAWQAGTTSRSMPRSTSE